MYLKKSLGNVLLGITTLLGVSMAPVSVQADDLNGNLDSLENKVIESEIVRNNSFQEKSTPEKDKEKDTKGRESEGMIKISENYVSRSINGTKYEKGIGLKFEAENFVPLCNYFEIGGNFNLSNTWFKIIGKGAEHKIFEIEHEFEGRFNWHNSDDLKVYSGVGINEEYFRENLRFEKAEGNQGRVLFGPKLSLIGIDSEYFNFELSSAVLWGEKFSSYDQRRSIRQEEGILSLIPKYDNFKIPIRVLFKHWGVNEEMIDRYNFWMNLSVSPEYNVNQDLGFSGKFGYVWVPSGNENYEEWQIGGAVYVRFQ